MVAPDRIFLLLLGISVFCLDDIVKFSIRRMEGQLPNIKKWIVLYPVYINSKKTMAEGRRIGLSKACENPTCAEIADCCGYLKIPFAIEVCCSMI